MHFFPVRVNEQLTAVAAILCEAYSGGGELFGSGLESVVGSSCPPGAQG